MKVHSIMMVPLLCHMSADHPGPAYDALLMKQQANAEASASDPRMVVLCIIVVLKQLARRSWRNIYKGEPWWTMEPDHNWMLGLGLFPWASPKCNNHTSLRWEYRCTLRQWSQCQAPISVGYTPSILVTSDFDFQLSIYSNGSPGVSSLQNIQHLQIIIVCRMPSHVSAGPMCNPQRWNP